MNWYKRLKTSSLYTPGKPSGEIPLGHYYAIQMRDGRVFYYTDATNHYDVLNRSRAPYKDIVATGWIEDGVFSPKPWGDPFQFREEAKKVPKTLKTSELLEPDKYLYFIYNDGNIEVIPADTNPQNAEIVHDDFENKVGVIAQGRYERLPGEDTGRASVIIMNHDRSPSRMRFYEQKAEQILRNKFGHDIKIYRYTD